MLQQRRITSAGDITMSTVLNMRDDTFMREAIKRDEARPGGIYSLCLSVYNSVPHDIIPPFISLCAFLHFLTHIFTLYIIALLLFRSLQETQLSNLTKHFF